MAIEKITDTLIYQRSESLTELHTHYCPGCTHGIAHRLIAEVLDELISVRKPLGLLQWGVVCLLIITLTVTL